MSGLWNWPEFTRCPASGAAIELISFISRYGSFHNSYTVSEYQACALYTDTVESLICVPCNYELGSKKSSYYAKQPGNKARVELSRDGVGSFRVGSGIETHRIHQTVTHRRLFTTKLCTVICWEPCRDSSFSISFEGHIKAFVKEFVRSVRRSHSLAGFYKEFLKRLKRGWGLFTWALQIS